jgi:hypothetical protein
MIFLSPVVYTQEGYCRGKYLHTESEVSENIILREKNWDRWKYFEHAQLQYLKIVKIIQ